MKPPPPPPASSGTPFPEVPEVIFANWREELHRSGLSPGIQGVFALALSGYLDYCARNGVSVTTASARAYMDDVVRRGLAKHPELWKDGLNWFFRTGRQHCATGQPPGAPPLGQADTGSQPWERRLIERLRIQHYAWRTEQTYRQWAWRLAQFIHPRDLESATEGRVSWEWFWFFPSRQASWDPHAGLQRRHHVLERALPSGPRRPRRAGASKRRRRWSPVALR